VKSAQQMVVTAEDLRVAGVRCPILVGGAALTASFTRKRIAPAYGGLVAFARDAMQGLELAHRVMDEDERAALTRELAAEAAPPAEPEAPASTGPVPALRSSRARVDLPIPPVADTERHILRELDLDEVWHFLNVQMLYGKHMGLRGNAKHLLELRDARALELKEVFERVMAECRNGGMKARAVFQFFRAEGAGNRLTLFDGLEGRELEHFDFPRQQRPDGLSLPDWVLPADGARRDHVCLFVTTAGEGIRERAERYKRDGEYLLSHALQALALETAEAAAEWLHARIRNMWGFPDPPELTTTQRFQAKYRGKRYSFGYPACPNLEDQAKLWTLLEPERIGVSLTEGFMMDPEASVSAVVFHHPDAAYFSVGKEDGE
jgi:5-methyltetrahydrofolate--homocysteine methyltransferase